jgi:hypothetical protein
MYRVFYLVRWEKMHHVGLGLLWIECVYVLLVLYWVFLS